jgi:hypothetical protein
MHPITLHDLIKDQTRGLHRQAGRDALSLAARRARPAPGARRARPAPAKTSTPFMPAHPTGELIRRMLTVLGARRPWHVQAHQGLRAFGSDATTRS